MTLDEHADHAYRDWSDIHEHVPLLRSYAAGHEVLELGVRWGVSTRAFLAGGPKRMVSVDLARMEFPEDLPALAEAAGIPWTRVYADSGNPLSAEFGDFDVTFVDTLHTAAHVRRELAAHAPRTRKFLLFHDTDEATANGVVGEDGGPGILEPINELLSTGEWAEHERHRNNHGLLVLKRIA